MPRCLFNSPIITFLATDTKSLLGSFNINYHGDRLTTTNEAWAGEIDIMQEILQPWKDEPWQVIFEYDIPRKEFQPSVYDDSIYNPLITGATGLQKIITDVLAHAGATEPDDTLNAEHMSI